MACEQEKTCGYVLAGGRLEHSNHEKKVFYGSLGSKGKSWQNCHPGFPEGRLCPVQEPDSVPWKAVLKGKIIQPGWIFFKKQILKTCVLEKELVGKKTCWA